MKKRLHLLVVLSLIAVLAGVATFSNSAQAAPVENGLPAQAATTTPTATGENFAPCSLPPAQPGVATFTYCLQRSPTNPNVYNINMRLNNNSQVSLDFSHTVVCVLGKGTVVGHVTAEPGAVTLQNSTNTATWHSSVLAPGASDSINFYITKAANNTILVNSVQISGLNLATNSPFTAVLPSFLAKTDAIEHVTSLTLSIKASTTNGSTTANNNTGLPQTGLGSHSQLQPQSFGVIWFIGSLLVVITLALGDLVWITQKTKKKV